MKKIALVALLVGLACGSVQAKELKPMTPRAPFSSLLLQDMDGKTHSLADYRGKVVLVNFWATWCPPCRAEMPSMQRLKQHMAGKPFVILAVDMAENKSQIHSFTQQLQPNIDFTILLDKEGKALRDWKVFVFPTSFILDANGRVRYSLLGSTEWDDASTMRTIEALMPRPW